MSALEPSTEDEEPVLTADRALVSAFVEAFIATRSRAESLEYLKATAGILSGRDDRHSVVLRLKRSDRERQKSDAAANRGAAALFRQMLEGFVARLPLDTDD